MSPFAAPDFQSLAKNLAPLVVLPRWMVWTHEQRGAKWTKIPRSARTGRAIDVSDPAGLCRFEEARAAYEDGKGRYAGVGFSIGEHASFVDLDGCRDAVTGEIAPWALETIKAAQSYAEIYPSGTGVHIHWIGSGSPIGTSIKNDDGSHYEIYRATTRYATCSGDRLPEFEHFDLADISPVIDKLAARKLRPAAKGNGNGSINRNANRNNDNNDNNDVEEDSLDYDLLILLQEGVPDEGHRSETFHQVVCGLRDHNGLTAAQIESLMRKYPNGIAHKWTSLNSVGVSSAIIRNSNKRSGSDISKDEAGVASTTTPRCASPPTDSLVSERERIPPSGPCYAPRFEKLAVPEGDRPGGSAAEDRTPRPQLDRDHAQKIDHRARQHFSARYSVISRGALG